MWFIMCACSSFCYTFVYFAFVKVQFCAWFACFVILRWQNNDICISFVWDYGRWVYRLWLFVVLFNVWYLICSLREAILPSRVCEGRGRDTIERDGRLLPRRELLSPRSLLSVRRARGFVSSARFAKQWPTRARICARPLFFVFCLHLFTFGW